MEQAVVHVHHGFDGGEIHDAVPGAAAQGAVRPGPYAGPVLHLAHWRPPKDGRVRQDRSPGRRAPAVARATGCSVPVAPAVTSDTRAPLQLPWTTRFERAKFSASKEEHVRNHPGVGGGGGLHHAGHLGGKNAVWSRHAIRTVSRAQRLPARVGGGDGRRPAAAQRARGGPAAAGGGSRGGHAEQAQRDRGAARFHRAPACQAAGRGAARLTKALASPEWRNGRRRGLKIPRGQPRESSTLSSGTVQATRLATPPSISIFLRCARVPPLTPRTSSAETPGISGSPVRQTAIWPFAAGP